MKILITGATGFIGSHLIKYLGNLGYEVDIYDKKLLLAEDWSPLYDMNIKKKQAVMAPNQPDVLIHCAWPTKIDLQATDHLEMAELSCVLFEQCKRHGVRVINMGSSSEYGPKDEPMQEDMPCNPITTYGIAKLAVTLFAKKLGFNTLRLFSVYGEGGKNFASIAKTVTKLSSPFDVRDYVSVQFVCEAVERLLHAQHFYGEIINVGSGAEETNGKVFARANPLRGPKADRITWHTYPQRQYEPKRWVADTTKLDKLLNIETNSELWPSWREQK